MQTIMVIAVYEDGSREQFETASVNLPREWQASMKKVGKSITKQVYTIVVIDGLHVAQYNSDECSEIFGV